jgi:hypothetical protein
MEQVRDRVKWWALALGLVNLQPELINTGSEKTIRPICFISKCLQWKTMLFVHGGPFKQFIRPYRADDLTHTVLASFISLTVIPFYTLSKYLLLLLVRGSKFGSYPVSGSKLIVPSFPGKAETIVSSLSAQLYLIFRARRSFITVT